MIHNVQIGERLFAIAVERHPDGTITYSVDGGAKTTVHSEVGTKLARHELVLRHQDNAERYTFDRRKNGIHAVHHARLGRSLEVAVLDAKAMADRRKRVAGGAAGEWSLNAPMPGRVTKMLVAVGDTVAQGQPVVVVEAMKMENELRAPHAGKIVAIGGQVGVAVDAGAMLIKAGPLSA